MNIENPFLIALLVAVINKFGEMKKILCFGEVLWDILPNGSEKIGGAPLNVAYHLKKSGIDAGIISRIGTDSYAEGLLQFLQRIHLPLDWVQRDEQYQTGKAIATLAGHHEMVYDIVFPAAWDFIAFGKEHQAILQTVDAFVYGSLSSRNEVSRQSLFQMLAYSNYNVFDVNIRKPYVDMEVMAYLLSKSHVLKVNEIETVLLGAHYGFGTVEKEIVLQLMNRFSIAEVIVTKGEKGGTYYSENKTLNYEAVPVKVKDTVGSGDSFLAGFLSERVKGATIEECLDKAAKLSGLITSLEGGCPEYDENSC